jgi:hypothetical protein
MTKKTSALLLRFGFSTFWKARGVSNSNILIMLQLENIVYKELKKKKLVLLKSTYEVKCISIDVYNNVQRFNRIFRKQVVLYYKQGFSLKAIVCKFGVCERYILWFLRRAKIVIKRPVKVNRCSIFVNSTIFLFIRYLLKLFKVNLIFIKRCFRILKQIVIIKSLNFLVHYFYSSNTFILKNRKQGFNKKRRYVQGIIYFRSYMLQLANIIFWRCGLIFNVIITHVFLKKNIIYLSFKWKYFKWFERFLAYTIVISSKYFNSQLLAKYISNFILVSKNHFRDLKIFVDYFRKFVDKNIFSMFGVLLRLTGKVGGRMRKRKYQVKLGQTPSLTFDFKISYCQSLSFTRFGVISIKLWFFRKIKNL